VPLAGEAHVQHESGAVAVGVFVRDAVAEGCARQVLVSDWTMLSEEIEIVFLVDGNQVIQNVR
jgi:hypothetical protein